nr:methyltransferase [Streptomyces sp. NBC_00995]
MATDPYALGKLFHEAQCASTDRQSHFTLLGRQWIRLPGVYSPALGAATEFFSANLPYPRDGHFLEIGSGTGVTAVCAALRGCRRVTATDMTSSAVRNTTMNIKFHGVSATVNVLKSDLFDALSAAERYDLIYWNSNYIHAPATETYDGDMQRALFDPGYATHRRYLAQGPSRLGSQGRLLLGFSSLGDHAALHRLADDARLTVTTLCAKQSVIGGDLEIPIELQLLELTRAA